MRPPGEWIKIAMTLAARKHTTRSISRTARLFALLGTALADSVIPTWSNKYNFQTWRPGTAIVEADADGNPLTVADPRWVSRNGSLGSSPEHTSGQSTFAGAGSTVLAGFYCTDFIPFSFEGMMRPPGHELSRASPRQLGKQAELGHLRGYTSTSAIRLGRLRGDGWPIRS